MEHGQYSEENQMKNAYNSLQTNSAINNCKNIKKVTNALAYVQRQGLHTEEKYSLYEKLLARKQKLARQARNASRVGGRRTRKHRTQKHKNSK
jgi:hypothetical protein